MKTLNFPVKLTFNIATFTNDFTARDADGLIIAYVKQKLFKLKETINVFESEIQQQLKYTIQADRWIDFSAAYSFKDKEGKEFGKIARKGWRSIWKAHYELIDQHQNLQFHVREESAWVKVADSLFSQIPLVGMFTGYLFNPAYLVTDLQDKPVARLQKDPSFWGRKFTITKLQEIDADDQERIVLGLMMMILLERRRG